MASEKKSGIGGSVATFSRRLAKTPNITALLGADRVTWWPLGRSSRHFDAVVGWGQKDNTKRARRFSARQRIPYWRLEDGFIRSVGLGVDRDPPLSIICDDIGVYYDARHPSRLECLLAEETPALSESALLARAEALIETITSEGISKYNNTPPDAPTLEASTRPRVLVVDQTAGDLSIEYGLASGATFAAMLTAAISENPGAEILIKTHPDVIGGKKTGHFQAADLSANGHDGNIRILDQPFAPYPLLDAVDKVYVVSSQLGFEALLAGKQVVCFGAPFYSGWGLTDDRGSPIHRRGRTRTVREVFAAAYLLYPRYIVPHTGEPGEAEDVVAFLAHQRRQFARNTGQIYCFGFSEWKHNFIRAYLRAPGNHVHFPRSVRSAEARGFDSSSKLITWGHRSSAEAEQLMTKHGVPRWRMEDAFLRSVGLGSDLTTPASLVLDREGIYYDPTSPSELERICEADDFEEADVARAQVLRERIIETRLSKYNVGKSVTIDSPKEKKLILVPGQVEDDASIQRGCPSICTNAGLLEAVREARPDAYILWKPHPDVVSGNRVGAVAPEIARRFADRIEDNVSLADCLAAADEVHTMTSLVGFEALMRDIRVVVYGLPFYAGWGLTEDRHRIARRSRTLTINELCVAALIRYPRYVHPVTLRFSSPEVTLDLLAKARDAAPEGGGLKISWARRQTRKLVNVTKNIAKELTRAP